MENILNIASDYVTRLLKSHLQKGITYHNLSHTKEVVNISKSLGDKAEITPDEMELLLIAAWFHDVGIIFQYDLHELKGAELCREFLTNHLYPASKIKMISQMILSTRIPQKPSNILEKILCDSDLAYTGTKNFNSRSQLLRLEWKNMLGKEFSDSEWLKINIDFLLKNKFHTRFAKTLFNEGREKNLIWLQKISSKTSGEKIKINQISKAENIGD